MLNFLKNILGYLLVKNNLIRKNKENDILSILFHNPSKNLFEKIIRWLIKHRYRIISLKEFETIVGDGLIKENIAIITFDDGWKGNLDLIELIEKYQTPVAIFIPTDPVITGNYWFEFAKIKGQQKQTGIKNSKEYKNLPANKLSEKIGILKCLYSLRRSCITLDELKLISNHQYITIGSHTVTHPILSKCPIEMQEFEIGQSKTILDDWLKSNTTYLAYPNGNYDEHTLSVADKFNYTLCFTISPEEIDIKNINPFEIPRRCINESGGYFENLAKVLGVWQKKFSRKAYLQK